MKVGGGEELSSVIVVAVVVVVVNNVYLLEQRVKDEGVRMIQFSLLQACWRERMEPLLNILYMYIVF